jgi:hypothetical protein
MQEFLNWMTAALSVLYTESHVKTRSIGAMWFPGAMPCSVDASWGVVAGIEAVDCVDAIPRSLSADGDFVPYAGSCRLYWDCF